MACSSPLSSLSPLSVSQSHTHAHTHTHTQGAKKKAEKKAAKRPVANAASKKKKGVLKVVGKQRVVVVGKKVGAAKRRSPGKWVYVFT